MKWNSCTDVEPRRFRGIEAAAQARQIDFSTTQATYPISTIAPTAHVVRYYLCVDWLLGYVSLFVQVRQVAAFAI
jgi:hypothetical protein